MKTVFHFLMKASVLTCFSSLLFIYIALLVTVNYGSMFDDTDPLWHIAAGDWIRAHHAIPAHDPWSFTAGEYRWLNISWLWDSIFSYIHESLGWHGAVAINALLVAGMFVMLYCYCFARTQQHLASLLAVMNAIALFPLSLRPLQISNIMLIGWCWLLGSIYRGKLSAKWLYALPVSMLLWVNIHGGFILGAALLLAFFIEALLERKILLARQLFWIGELSLLAMICNPYGIYVFEAVWRTLGTPAKQFIQEWQPFLTSSENLKTFFYVGAFLWLVPRRDLAITKAERALAYIWLWLALTCSRNLTIFAIFSAPMFAMSLMQVLTPIMSLPLLAKLSEKIQTFCTRKTIAALAMTLCIAFGIWLPTPIATRAFGHEHLSPTDLDSEIHFILENYPKTKLLINYDLAGTILYQTRGAIPVFLDPRVETAFPRQVVNDYITFSDDYKNWDAILTSYGINGVLLPNSKEKILFERFYGRPGWKMAYRGPKATLFIRQHR